MHELTSKHNFFWFLLLLTTYVLISICLLTAVKGHTAWRRHFTARFRSESSSSWYFLSYFSKISRLFFFLWKKIATIQFSFTFIRELNFAISLLDSALFLPWWGKRDWPRLTLDLSCFCRFRPNLVTSTTNCAPHVTWRDFDLHLTFDLVTMVELWFHLKMLLFPQTTVMMRWLHDVTWCWSVHMGY